jgi:hypothetical protein
MGGLAFKLGDFFTQTHLVTLAVGQIAFFANPFSLFSETEEAARPVEAVPEEDRGCLGEGSAACQAAASGRKARVSCHCRKLSLPEAVVGTKTDF